MNGGTGTNTGTAASLSYTLNGVTAGDLVLVGVAAFTVPGGRRLPAPDGYEHLCPGCDRPRFANDIVRGDLPLGRDDRREPHDHGHAAYLLRLVDGCRRVQLPCGDFIALDGVVATGTGSGTNQTTGNLSPTTVGLVYGVSTGVAEQYRHDDGRVGFTPRYNYSPVPSGKTPIVCEDIAANTTSPIAVTSTAGPAAIGRSWAWRTRRTVPPINPIPSRIPAEPPETRSRSRSTGTGDELDGAPFSVTGDATLVGQQVISTTSAKISVSTSTATGSATISDGTFTATLTVVHATLAGAAGPRATPSTTVTVTGTNTFWLSEPVSPPLFSVSGVAGLSLSNIVVTGNTAATFTLTSGSATGSATITDNSTTALAATTVFALAPRSRSRRLHPGELDQFTLALTGTNTNWSGNPFILSGVTGVTLVSQTVTSNTAASIVVSTGTTTEH